MHEFRIVTERKEAGDILGHVHIQYTVRFFPVLLDLEKKLEFTTNLLAVVDVVFKDILQSILAHTLCKLLNTIKNTKLVRSYLAYLAFKSV